MNFNPFAHQSAKVLRQQALAKALVDLHESKFMAESWNAQLALQTARVARLQSEIADSTLEFPPLDKAAKPFKLLGAKTL